MTNGEYFISLLGFAPSANLVEGAITDASLVAADTYSTANTVALKTAAIGALELLLSTADTTQGTGETSFAIKYDRDAIMKRIALLKDQLGITDGRPTIKGIHPW